MSNPVFFAAPGTLDGLAPGDVFVLDGPEARHAVTVKRLAVGEVNLLSGTSPDPIAHVTSTYSIPNAG